MIKFCKVLVTPLGVELDMMKNNKLRFTFFLAAILAASLACNFPGVSPQATSPTAPVPVSSEAVQELEENLRSAAATAASGGVVNLVITEAQLTSLASLELQAIQDPKIENIQIRLRDGQIFNNSQGDGQWRRTGFIAHLERNYRGRWYPKNANCLCETGSTATAGQHRRSIHSGD